MLIKNFYKVVDLEVLVIGWRNFGSLMINSRIDPTKCSMQERKIGWGPVGRNEGERLHRSVLLKGRYGLDPRKIDKWDFSKGKFLQVWEGRDMLKRLDRKIFKFEEF